MIAALTLPVTGNAQLKFARNIYGWHIFRSDNTCHAQSSINASISTHLAIQVKSTGRVELSFRNDAWKLKKAEKINVTTAIGDKIYSFRPKPVLNNNIYINSMATFIDEAAIDILADNQMIDIKLDGEESKQLVIPELSNVVHSLKRCSAVEDEDLADKWIKILPYQDDHAENRSGQTRAPAPHDTVDRWLNRNDYPSRAQREQLSGSVAVLLIVKENGRVKDCKVTESSGSVIFDQVACKNLFRRARFFPATDYNGLPVEGVFPLAVQFTPPPMSRPMIQYQPVPAFIPAV